MQYLKWKIKKLENESQFFFTRFLVAFASSDPELNGMGLETIGGITGGRCGLNWDKEGNPGFLAIAVGCWGTEDGVGTLLIGRSIIVATALLAVAAAEVALVDVFIGIW